MALDIEGIECPAGEWTLIADAPESCVFKIRGLGTAYLAKGATAPGGDPPSAFIHFWTLQSRRPTPALSGLSSGDRLWVFPAGEDDMIIEVMST